MGTSNREVIIPSLMTHFWHHQLAMGLKNLNGVSSDQTDTSPWREWGAQWTAVSFTLSPTHLTSLVRQSRGVKRLFLDSLRNTYKGTYEGERILVRLTNNNSLIKVTKPGLLNYCTLQPDRHVGGCVLPQADYHRLLWHGLHGDVTSFFKEAIHVYHRRTGV